MSATAKALDALDESIGAVFPKPGNWRWNVIPPSKSVYLGTHNWEAMSFARWGLNGAQPRFLTALPGGGRILQDGATFLQPIPGREHHDWEKRIEHPVAQLIERAVNLSAPLAAVARAVLDRSWWVIEIEMVSGRNVVRCVLCRASTIDSGSGRAISHVIGCELATADAALDALEAAAAQGGAS